MAEESEVQVEAGPEPKRSPITEQIAKDKGVVGARVRKNAAREGVRVASDSRRPKPPGEAAAWQAKQKARREAARTSRPINRPSGARKGEKGSPKGATASRLGFDSSAAEAE